MVREASFLIVIKMEWDKIVYCGDFGSLQLVLSTESAETEKPFHPIHIEVLKSNFCPGKDSKYVT